MKCEMLIDIECSGSSAADEKDVYNFDISTNF